MIKRFPLLILFTLNTFLLRATDVRFLQQPSISPDGRWIAFEYKSNLYKVPVTGGQATALTANNSYNAYPVWSHDGKFIAFSSNRYGNFDVFIMPASGGNANRLTFSSTTEIPYDFSPDDQTVYFGTNREEVYTSLRTPIRYLWMKLFSVPVTGGKSILVNAAGTRKVRFNAPGDEFLFEDEKGSENPYRKHHRSPVNRDIWKFSRQTGKYTRLTIGGGDHLEPVWGGNNDIYYLTDTCGTLNIVHRTLDVRNQVSLVTRFTKDPVRHLSRSANGMIAFTQQGQLYTLNDKQPPQKIRVEINADFNCDQIRTLPLTENATEFALSPNGKEIVYVYHGDIFATAVNGSATRRITNTPFEEKMVSFSNDGRTLLYSAETDGSWNIYTASLTHPDDPYFYACTGITINALIHSPKDEYQSSYSPNGKKVAYLEERNVLKVYDLADHTAVIVSPEGLNYSYTDGDQFFSWSPDSKYILMNSNEGFSETSNAVVLRADGKGNRTKITQNGFSVSQPRWSADGKFIYYLSDKDGLKHLSQGSNPADVYAVFLDKTEFYRYHTPETDQEVFNAIRHLRDSIDPKKPVNEKKQKVNTNDHNLDPQVLAAQTMKLTDHAVNIADAVLAPDGESLYILAKYDNGFDLWSVTVRSRERKLLAKLDLGGGTLVPSSDGEWLYLLADGKILKISVKDGGKESVPVNPEMSVNEGQERAYIFEHTYNLISKKFYDPQFKGIDWAYYYRVYKQFLPDINNDYDFQVLLSEFLGELNSSHTGAQLFNPDVVNKDQTAALGLLYDQTYPGDGLKVTDVLQGGPFDYPGTHMTRGCMIDQINDHSLKKELDWTGALNKKADQFVRISFHNARNETYEEVIKPISFNTEIEQLMYTRWVKKMEHLTDSLSKGKVGYIHIPEMNEEALKETIDQLKGKNRDKSAVIIDVRYNTGGNIHDQLNRLLGEKTMITYRPQGHKIALDKLKNGLPKPTCVLISAGNYSDGYNFPLQYQKLGLGKLIGTPVAGTGTGVWWQDQIDNRITIGIPMLGLSWAGEEQLFENQALIPDIQVENHFEQLLKGTDEQLATAVREMMREIERKHD